MGKSFKRNSDYGRKFESCRKAAKKVAKKNRKPQFDPEPDRVPTPENYNGWEN